MGFYNNKALFNGFKLCPVTQQKVTDDNFVSTNVVYDGYEYLLLNINPNVVIGLEYQFLYDEASQKVLRKHSDKIIQLIKDCKKPFFEVDSILLNELEKSGQ